ncbi:MAG TPA: tRNA (adenosine(37)-N6)-threonylcarbamoyltransferase complex transferase subunit TsaD [Clostridia bacterium]|nr:tRNA (adenosine(37)-N6)-threonylcarbamoyltransferase complex transferase subunit TsaD [Clostridia bacterium]
MLGIETSCDETAASVAKRMDSAMGLAPKLLSNVVSSQLEVHKKYGGVVPEIASRKHLEAIIPVINEAIQTAGVGPGDLSGIAVTSRPGLVGALVVGVSTAKALALAWNLPLVGVNHVLGHVYAGFVDSAPKFPFMALVVSGGHTVLIHMLSHTQYQVVGRTRDDAAGEAFDKVARLLGLGYPGGPAVDALAKRGDPNAVKFPRAHLEPESLDFSFSGLKTAVMVFMEKAKRQGRTVPVEDLAASFQEAVCDILVEKTLKAAELYNTRRVLVAGGVSANSRLREMLTDSSQRLGVEVIIPPISLCTDNAAMIAIRGLYLFEEGVRDDLYLNASADSPVS